MKIPPLLAVLSLALVAFALPAEAQQITGTPGAPDATTTIDGKQLPVAPSTFGGVMKQNAVQSPPYWPTAANQKVAA